MVRFESRTVAQILAEKAEAKRITQQRFKEVPIRFAELANRGVIDTQMAQDLTSLHEKNEDGICPVALQIYNLLEAFNNPQTEEGARNEAGLIIALSRRNSANE